MRDLADLLRHLRRGPLLLREEGDFPEALASLVQVIPTALGPVAHLTRLGARLLGARHRPLLEENLAREGFLHRLELDLRWLSLEARRYPAHLWAWSPTGRLLVWMSRKKPPATPFLYVGPDRRRKAVASLPLEPGSYPHALEICYVHLTGQALHELPPPFRGYPPNLEGVGLVGSELPPD